MLDEIVERNFFICAEHESELAVKFGRFGSEERGGDGRNGDRDFMRGKTPEADGAGFLNFVVRRQSRMREYVECRNQLGRRQFAAFEQYFEKRFDGGKQRFGLFVAVDYDEERFLRSLIKEHEIQCFSSVDKAGNGKGALLAAG